MNNVIIRLFTIDILQNNRFGSHDMVVLYSKTALSEACYNEVKLYHKGKACKINSKGRLACSKYPLHVLTQLKNRCFLLAILNLILN